MNWNSFLNLSFFPDTFSGQEEKDAKPLPRINRHSVFWILASVGVTYYVDFLRNIMENGDIKRWLELWGRHKEFPAGLVR